MTEHTINLHVLARDGGDGSMTIYAAQTVDDLRKRTGMENDDEWQAIIDGDDPYEEGSYGRDTMKVVVNDDGSITIPAFSLYSHNQ